MMKLSRSLGCLGALPMVLSLPLEVPMAEAAQPPNVIFILVDDLGYGDLGSYGQTLIRTPHLDRMAQEGMRFTQVYAGSPICAPARSSLLTGQHVGTTRIRGNFGTPGFGVQDSDGNWRVPLLPEDVTLAEVLREAGFVTGITGKWGLGEPDTTGIPNLQGFDEWYGLLNQRQAHSHFPRYLWRNQTREFLPGNSGTTQNFAVEAHYVQDLFLDFTLDFIERHAQTEQPFFLYLPYTLPHSAFQIPQLEDYTVNTNWSLQEKYYASMVTRLDRDIGRIFDLLQAQGIDENTLVFFTSDNGAADRYDSRFNSSGPLRGRKRDVYEGGIRTPMLVRWPGQVAAGETSDAIWYFADVLPTLADLASVAVPPEVNGVSILPTLRSQPQPELAERPLYWEFHEEQFAQAIRKGRWKAVRQNPHLATELYDLHTDVGETQNVASVHPTRVAQFERLFISMRSSTLIWPTVLDGLTVDEEARLPAFDGGWLPIDHSSLDLCLDHARLGGDAHMFGFAAAHQGVDAQGPYLRFGGDGRHLRVTGQVGAAGSEPRTVAAWIRTQHAGGVIISWGNREVPGAAWVMRLDPTTRALRVEVQNGFAVGSTPLNDNQWHHVAAVFDPAVASGNVTGVRLYVNGVQQSLASSGARLVNTAANTPIWIGGESARPDLFFQGDLRHVQWMPRALSAEAVAQLARVDLTRASRWHLTHFAQAQPDWQRVADGSGKALLLHYATGAAEAEHIADLVKLHQATDGSLTLSARRDPLAAVTLIPEISTELHQHWHRPEENFSHLPEEGFHQRWRVQAPVVGEPLFIRVAYSVSD